MAIKKSIMNTNTESNHASEQAKAWFSKLIASSAAVSVGLVLAATGLLLAVPCAQAQANLTMADTDFILAAAQGGMTEVQLGELASTNGMRDDVKAFGQRMVKDHTTINDDLKALAAQKSVTLPDNLNAKHQGMVDKMAALTGAEFDDAYIAAMVKAHTQDAATQDPDIKSFLDKSIPVVERHLEHVTAMKK
jgi:putative membrane protein